MTIPPIYTSEPMATRALGAEIRHAPDRFVELLATTIGVESLGEFQSVRCEASERIDLELKFAGGDFPTVGIEAKFDHELTRDQVDRQLAVVDRLVVLLVESEAAPSWLEDLNRVSVITWKDALGCFVDSRLTVDDIESMPVLKSTVEMRFNAQYLESRLPSDWRVRVKRGGSGMPAITIDSPALPNGRMLQGQIQVSGRAMPKPGEPVTIEYSIGVSVPADSENFPDPSAPHVEPGWIEPLRTLHRDVLNGDEERLLVSTHRPGNGNSELGKRKLPLAKMYLPGATWLAKGYTDGYALGIKSVNVPLDDLDVLAETVVDIFTRWFGVETKRLARAAF